MKLWRTRDAYIEEKGTECFVIVCGKVLRRFVGENKIVEADNYINQLYLIAQNGVQNAN